MTEVLEKENQNQPEEQETKTYTQEEVDALLQSEADRRVTEALKRQRRKTEKEIKEAEKLAKMDAEERHQYEIEQREKAVAEKEKQLAMAENRNTADKILANKGLSLDLVDLVLAEDAETMNENIKKLEKAFKESVKTEVEKRLVGGTPKRKAPPAEELTKEKFAKMSLAERQELKTNNPELYVQLRG